MLKNEGLSARTSDRALDEFIMAVQRLLKRLLSTRDLLARKLHFYVPLSPLNTMWRMLDKDTKSILDIGCGKGEPMMFINGRRKFRVVGIDIFKPYLEETKRQGVYRDIILGDVRHLPLKRKSFDAVMCLEVVEHLEKEDGERLLQAMEEVARKQVILSTPVGRFEHKDNFNPYQEHRSFWMPVELKRLGYKIRGYGLPLIGGQKGLLARLPEPLRTIRRIIWILASFFSQFFPESAGWMICTKILTSAS